MDTARKDRPQPQPQRERRQEQVTPVIARVREDARLEPRRWLEEAEVKAGGE